MVNLVSPNKLARKDGPPFSFLRPNATGRNVYVLATFILVGVCYYQLVSFDNNRLMWVYPVVFLSFIWNNFLLVSSFQYKPFSLDETSNSKELKTVVVIPVYNEDKIMFKKMLSSLDSQTQKPDVVYIIEDGSAKENSVEDIVRQWKKVFLSRLSTNTLLTVENEWLKAKHSMNTKIKLTYL